jgi:hypothetical protein
MNSKEEKEEAEKSLDKPIQFRSFYEGKLFVNKEVVLERRNSGIKLKKHYMIR